MSASVLPNEIFHHIFINLRGGDVLECRRVCRRWEAAVDALGDGFWRRMCAKEHIGEVYEDAYRKARLSWRDLYTSLSLWSDVAAADVEVLSIPEKHVNNYQVLTDGVIAVSCRTRRVSGEGDADKRGCDTIVYYDLAALTEQQGHRERFDFEFKQFEENDHLYVFELKGERLIENYIRVMLKSNRKCLDFGRDVRGTWTWVLYEDVAYLQCYEVGKCFYRVKVVKQNDDYTFETEEIRYPDYYFRIRAVANINSDQTNIFASEGRIHKSAQIYSLTHKDVKLICYIPTRDDGSHRIIKSHGFSLRCLPIFELFSRYAFDDDDDVPETIFYHYAKTVLLFKQEKHLKYIDIFYIPLHNPYETDGKLNLNKAKATKSIEIGVVGSEEADLLQMDVVEVVNGHRVIVALRGRIIVIELNHKASELRTISDSDDFYNTVFNTQNRLIYTTYDYHRTNHTNYAID